MATRRKAAKGGATGEVRPTWARTAGGNVKSMFTISPEQDRALREEAFKRAMERGSRKPDASEILREVLDEWLAKRSR